MITYVIRCRDAFSAITDASNASKQSETKKHRSRRRLEIWFNHAVANGFVLTYTLPNFITSEWFAFTYDPAAQVIKLQVNCEREVLLGVTFPALSVGKKRGANGLAIINGVIPIPNVVATTSSLSLPATTSSVVATSVATTDTTRSSSSVSIPVAVTTASTSVVTTAITVIQPPVKTNAPDQTYYVPQTSQYGASKPSTVSKNVYVSGSSALAVLYPMIAAILVLNA